MRHFAFFLLFFRGDGGQVELKSGKDADVTSFPADEDIVIKK